MVRSVRKRQNNCCTNQKNCCATVVQIWKTWGFTPRGSVAYACCVVCVVLRVALCCVCCVLHVCCACLRVFVCVCICLHVFVCVCMWLRFVCVALCVCWVFVVVCWRDGGRRAYLYKPSALFLLCSLLLQCAMQILKK